jgi:hypothetical protein
VASLRFKYKGKEIEAQLCVWAWTINPTTIKLNYIRWSMPRMHKRSQQHTLNTSQRTRRTRSNPKMRTLKKHLPNKSEGAITMREIDEVRHLRADRRRRGEERIAREGRRRRREGRQRSDGALAKSGKIKDDEEA